MGLETEVQVLLVELKVYPAAELYHKSGKLIETYVLAGRVRVDPEKSTVKV